MDPSISNNIRALYQYSQSDDWHLFKNDQDEFITVQGSESPGNFVEVELFNALSSANSMLERLNKRISSVRAELLQQIPRLKPIEKKPGLLGIANEAEAKQEELARKKNEEIGKLVAERIDKKEEELGLQKEMLEKAINQLAQRKILNLVAPQELAAVGMAAPLESKNEIKKSELTVPFDPLSSPRMYNEEGVSHLFNLLHQEIAKVISVSQDDEEEAQAVGALLQEWRGKWPELFEHFADLRLDVTRMEAALKLKNKAHENNEAKTSQEVAEELTKPSPTIAEDKLERAPAEIVYTLLENLRAVLQEETKFLEKNIVETNNALSVSIEAKLPESIEGKQPELSEEAKNRFHHNLLAHMKGKPTIEAKPEEISDLERAMDLKLHGDIAFITKVYEFSHQALDPLVKALDQFQQENKLADAAVLLDSIAKIFKESDEESRLNFVKVRFAELISKIQQAGYPMPNL